MTHPEDNNVWELLLVLRLKRQTERWRGRYQNRWARQFWGEERAVQLKLETLTNACNHCQPIAWREGAEEEPSSLLPPSAHPAESNQKPEGRVTYWAPQRPASWRGGTGGKEHGRGGPHRERPTQSLGKKLVEGLRLEGDAVAQLSQSKVTPGPSCSSLGANLALSLGGAQEQPDRVLPRDVTNTAGKVGHPGGWV